MQTQETNQSLNKELSEIIQSCPPNKMWGKKEKILEIEKAIKSKNEFYKRRIISKYKHGI